MFVELLIFFGFLITLKLFLSRHPPNIPPGPFKFPGIGSGLPVVESRCIQSQKKYGDVYMDQIGNRYWMTICDYKLAKECLARPEVSSRPYLKFLEELGGGEIRGIISVNGEHWKSNRRFILRHLRDLGMGKSSLEQSIQMETSELIKYMKTKCGPKVDIPNLAIKSAVLNVIWQMIASKRYDLEDPLISKINDLQKELQEVSGSLVVLEFFPVLKKLIPKRLINFMYKGKSFMPFFTEVQNIIKPLIKEHEENLDPECPKDLIDAYLIELKENKELLPQFACWQDLQSITVDLFSAGSDTINNSLRRTLLYMAAYPEIQEKVRNEIDTVVPRNELPNSIHRSRLPYCEAMLHESLRKASFTSFNVSRANLEAINVDGYHIPQDTIIAVASFFIHHDKRYWKHPDVYYPMRFIDENGKFVLPKEGFLPFGSGRRQCVGEALARVEYYSFALALIQNFIFSPCNGKEIDLTATGNGLTGRLVQEQTISMEFRP